MATNSTAQWWIRKGGSDANGGGFDSGIAGAGTNYANADAPARALSGATCALNATKIYPSGGACLAAHVGNAIQITGGTNFIKDIYWIVGYDSTSAAYYTLDRTPCTAGAGTGGTGNLGGAFATLAPLSTASSGNPVSTFASHNQLVPGNTVYLVGGGNNDPSLGGTSVPNADFAWPGYWSIPTGTPTSEIRFVGVNGRPLIAMAGLLLLSCNYTTFVNMKFAFKDPGGFSSYGILNGVTSMLGCIVDSNGYDVVGCSALRVACNEFRNSGGGAWGGVYSAITQNALGFKCIGNYIHGWRGGGINSGQDGTFAYNLIVSTGGDAVKLTNSPGYYGGPYSYTLLNNTVAYNSGAGLNSVNSYDLSYSVIQNNIIAFNSGYGVMSSDLTADPNITPIAWGFNDIFGNAAGNYHNITAPGTDFSVDPQFTDHASGDYSVGAALRGTGTPGTLPGSDSTGYATPGAIQPQAGSGGAASAGPFPLLSTLTICPQ